MKTKHKDKNNILLIGNPNVGKTTFFNHLTTSIGSVGNFDRTTISINSGKLKRDKKTIISDLPGIYNLNSNGDDDKVVLKSLFNKSFNGIINVTNINSFARDMQLTLQLLESQQSVVIALNMVDELKNKTININKIAMKLRTNVVLTNAKKDQGLDQIKRNIVCPMTTFKLEYPVEVEKNITKIISLLEDTNLPKRFYAIQILERNSFALEYIQKSQKNYQQIIDIIDESCKKIINKTRTLFIEDLYNKSFTNNGLSDNKSFSKLDNILLKKITAIPIFLFVLGLIYFITFGPYTGGFLNKQIDYLFNDLLINIIKDGLLKINSPTFLTGLIANGIIGGCFAVLPFLPYILILFLFVGLLRQSGYISRVSAVTDQILSPFGLTGRSVIGLISGIGCNVPTILMARSSKSQKEKFISIFIAPFISCSARATVFSFLASMVFANNIWLAVLLLQIFSGIVALMIGLLFSKTMFRKMNNIFFIELPRWRKPDFKTIFKLIWFELKTFLIRVGKFVLLGSVIVWLLSHIGIKGILDDSEVQNSFVGYIGLGFSYILYPIGLFDWRIASSLLLAFPAKELAVTNMLIVFNGENNIQTYFTVSKAISFMVFFVLYIPCLSTMAVTKKEQNSKVMVYNILVSLLVGYLFALVAYWISFGIFGVN